MDKLKQRIELFKFHDVYRPELASRIESATTVDYFPRGNEAFISDLVDTFKKYIQQKVQLS